MELHNIRFWRVVLAVTSALSLITLIQMLGIIQAVGANPLHSKWTILLSLVALATLLELSLLGYTWTKRGQDWVQLSEKWISSISKSRKSLNFLSFAPITLFPCLILLSSLRGILTIASNRYLIIGSWHGAAVEMIDMVGRIFVQRGSRGDLATWGLHWWLFWLCGLFASLLLRAGKDGAKPEFALLEALLSQAMIYKVVSYLSSISSYPFSMWWTEGNRMYFASLLIAGKLYHQSIPLSFINPTQDILSAVPFLLGSNSIFIYRLWQAALELGTTIGVAILLGKQLRIENRSIYWLLVMWCTLYLRLETGVFYPLLLVVLIVLAGYSSRHPWRVGISLVVASFWAGMSRFNWLPIPSMLAVTLYLLQEPFENYRNFWHYLLKPFFWSLLGIAAAISGMLLMNHLNGIDLSVYGTFLSSALLWYRLLPNATYSPGILLAISFVSLPLWWIIAATLRGHIRQWHPIRLVGVALISLVLFVGGLVASIKIGGGSNLHNLDAYLVVSILIAVFLYFNRFVPDKEVRANPISFPGIALAILIPVFLTIRVAEIPLAYSPIQVNEKLQTLKGYVESAAKEGEVLFMEQRQLITFHNIQIPLVPEYETVTLTEMAFWKEGTGPNQFQDDLRRHRFALIVAGMQPEGLKGQQFSFPEENNVWYTRVTQPLMCEYEIAYSFPELGIQLLKPRMTNDVCTSY